MICLLTELLRKLSFKPIITRAAVEKLLETVTRQFRRSVQKVFRNLPSIFLACFSYKSIDEHLKAGEKFNQVGLKHVQASFLFT